MKLSFFDKIKMKKDKYNSAFLDELRNNSIVLSFAFSIIIIGIISIFFNIGNKSLLIGIAISSLLLTVIQCFGNGNTILNIFPIFTLLLFGFFQKFIENIPVINVLVKNEYSNLIIFLAFSLTFFTQSYKNIIFKHKVSSIILDNNIDKNKMIYRELDIINNIKEKALKLKEISENRNYSDSSFNNTLDELIDYVIDETFVSNVKSSLITKGNDDGKTSFDINEIEESIILNCGINRNRKINVYNEK